MSWGEQTARPDGIRSVAGDREFALAMSDGSGTPTTVASGDLRRTVGGVADGPARSVASGQVLALPIDLIDLRLDGRASGPAAAHVLLRSERRRGGLLRGPVVMVMNAEFMGNWDIAPWGHPNDGKVEVVSCGPELSLRQRLAARRRLANGTHLPHPDISIRSLATASFRFDHPMVVVVDGQRLGCARSVEFDVRPDAAMLYL